MTNSDHSDDSSGGMLGGVVMVLGALAYKSLKKRKLQIVRSSKTRQTLEIFALLAIIALVTLQRDFKVQLTNDPVPNFVIPLWALIAYGILYLKRPGGIDQQSG
jgi:multisubunit Na+/H+ antiporter MnhB subunit